MNEKLQVLASSSANQHHKIQTTGRDFAIYGTGTVPPRSTDRFVVIGILDLLGPGAVVILYLRLQVVCTATGVDSIGKLLPLYPYLLEVGSR